MKNKTNHRSVAFRRAEVKKRRIYTHFILLCICIFRFAQMSQYSLYSYILHIQTYIYYWNSVVSLKPYPEKSTHKPKKKTYILLFSFIYFFVLWFWLLLLFNIISPKTQWRFCELFNFSSNLQPSKFHVCRIYIYIYIPNSDGSWNIE